MPVLIVHAIRPSHACTRLDPPRLALRSAPQLKDVILKLLVKDIPKRLGCMRGGAGDIKAHKFFRELDWDALRARRIPAPWRPRLSNPLDTSNFDEYEEDDSVEHYRDDGSHWDKDF